MRKKILSLVLSALMAGSLLVGCGNSSGSASGSPASGDNSVAASSNEGGSSGASDGEIKIGVLSGALQTFWVPSVR